MASTFSPGQRVSAAGLFRDGEVISAQNSRGEYQIRVGAMNVWVAGERLQPYKISKKDKKARGTSGTGKNAAAPTGDGGSIKIDLHGKTVKEAEEILTSTLDNALVKGVSVIEVVHGIGSGKIKSFVHKFAEGSSHIAELREDMANPGRCLLYL